MSQKTVVRTVDAVEMEDVARLAFKNTFLDMQQLLTDRYFFLAELPPRSAISPQFTSLSQNVALDVVEEALTWSLKASGELGTTYRVEASEQDSLTLREALIPFLKSEVMDYLAESCATLEGEFTAGMLDEPLGTGIPRYTTKVQQAISEGIALGCHHVESVFTCLEKETLPQLLQEPVDDYKIAMQHAQRIALPEFRGSRFKASSPLTMIMKEVARESILSAFEVATRPVDPIVFAGGILTHIGVPSAFVYDPQTPAVLKTGALAGREMGKVLEAIRFDLMHGGLRHTVEQICHISTCIPAAGAIDLSKEVYAQASVPVHHAFNRVMKRLAQDMGIRNNYIVGTPSAKSITPHIEQNYSLH